MAESLIQRSRRKRPSEKATYHQDDGAGKSRVRREFFGLTTADEQAIEDLMGTAIDVNLRRNEGSR